MHGLRSEHHLTPLRLWMRSMVAGQFIHPTDHFHSLHEAATARDRAPEFYLSERDLGCIISSSHANQRMYANASTVRNVNEAFNLYISFL